VPLNDIAIPILPSRSVTDTLNFYQPLGFEGVIRGAAHDYAILRRGTLELHFFTHRDLDPAASCAGCYLRVSDVESIYQDFLRAELPTRGIPRICRLENKPWGLREFSIVDADGNLLRIGQPLQA